MVKPWPLLLLLLLRPAIAPARQEAAELFIESSLSPAAPYVQQQVTYEIRVYRRSNLLKGDLLLPEIPGVVVEPLGEEEPRRVEVGEREYQLIRSRYLLFPQHSGNITLPGVVYSGWQAYARGEALELRVRPAPGGVRGDTWLPARGLRLEEQWSPALTGWTRGRPVERRVTLEARGLTAAQLPPPPVSGLPGLRIRAAGTRFHNHTEGGELIGRREDTLVYLPLRAGPLELPALTLEWWSTDRNRAETATLPAHRLEVAAAFPAPHPGPRKEIAETTTEIDRGTEHFGIWFLIMALLPAAVVLGLLRFHKPLYRFLRLRLLCARFAAACRRNRPGEAWLALASWSQLNWDAPPASPGTLAGRLADARAAAGLWSLDAALYGKPPAGWDGRSAARAIAPALKRRRAPRRRSPSALPGLDP